MQHFIVIGNPITHSKSPDLHHAFADSAGLDISYRRQLCPDNKDSFNAVVEAFFNGGGVGANVTLPFKEIAFELCSQMGNLSEYATTAKAVNTLALRDGKLFGDNTDGRGLVADLLDEGVTLQGAHIAIIGAGGATRGAILPLIEQGARLTIFNRTLARAEALKADFETFGSIDINELHILKSGDFYADVIINATSATTTGQMLELSCGVRAGFAYDMMYGKPSEFLAHFEHQGVRCCDGYGMLIQQAKLAFELWTGKRVDLDKVDWDKHINNKINS